ADPSDIMVEARKEEHVGGLLQEAEESRAGQPARELDPVCDAELSGEAPEPLFLGTASAHDQTPAFHMRDRSDREVDALQEDEATREQRRPRSRGRAGR